jgi:hypothetical protein
MIVFVNGHTFTMPYPSGITTYNDITNLNAYLSENISAFAPSGYDNSNYYEFDAARIETNAFNPHGGYIV